MNINKKKLVDGCIEKKNWAYKEMYRRYQPMLLGICYRYAKEKSEAEDILLKGFMNIFQKIHMCNSPESLEAWLRKSMINTAIDHYRKYHKRAKHEDILDHENNMIINSDQLSQLTEKEILKLIQQLPDGYRMVLNLFVFEGYSHQEIAQKLNISENTSKTQLRKARKHIALKLTDYYRQ
ncbi:MAG: sigma-70 family RNA polymerase sigma factor [Bacteroidales bacterium]|nr:sigma-70 family RNA polymerase sigma factor [Bacteroidales bacterium]MCF8388528.1 sigma-70 family RNA polymerase sigma factor [Bacteroidales bacterium]MCF8397281.1 sigma-70 family RNA polymerase sigma factor [Bacteroidales bacterium]